MVLSSAQRILEQVARTTFLDNAKSLAHTAGACDLDRPAQRLRHDHFKDLSLQQEEKALTLKIRLQQDAVAKRLGSSVPSATRSRRYHMDVAAGISKHVALCKERERRRARQHSTMLATEEAAARIYEAVADEPAITFTMQIASVDQGSRVSFTSMAGELAYEFRVSPSTTLAAVKGKLAGRIRQKFRVVTSSGSIVGAAWSAVLAKDFEVTGSSEIGLLEIADKEEHLPARRVRNVQRKPRSKAQRTRKQTNKALQRSQSSAGGGTASKISAMTSVYHLRPGVDYPIGVRPMTTTT